MKPEMIEVHGTKIVLMGDGEGADTVKAPATASSPSRWIAKYLNSRYFRFPSRVTIRAREGWEHPRSDKDRNLLRRITGQQDYLKQHSLHHGTVQLTDAMAHWWILKDEPALSQNSGFVESSGHVAALYKDELYELTTARSGRARLQMFGVLVGHNRVVIYVEPCTNGSRRLTTNTARTQLLIDSQPLPWTDWAAEFRNSMPEQIAAHMEEVAAGSSASDHTKSIRERLKPIMDLYKVSRYRFTAAGALMVDEETTERGGQASIREATSARGSGGARPGKKGGTAGSVYGVFLKKEGAPGEQVNPDLFPETRWLSLKDGTREAGDIEDRAARFLSDQNILLINADFRVFTDMIEYWVKEFGKQPGVFDIVQDAVRGWFEQALVETVIGVQALKNSKEWNLDDLDKALSEESLTASVIARYHINNAVKRELGSKLGKLSVA